MKLRIKYILSLCFALPFIACQNNTQNKGIVTIENRAEIADTSFARNEYKYFTGTIGNMPVVVIIKSINGVLSGHYYYEKYRQTIPLTNQPAGQKNGVWRFVEAEIGTDTFQSSPIWKCTLKDGGVLSGSWQNADSNKRYPIKLKENYPKGVTRFTYQYSDTQAKAFPDWDSSPVAHITTCFPVASGVPGETAWLNQQIKLLLNFDTALSFEKGKQKWEKKYSAHYTKNLTGMDSSYLSASSSNWQSNQEVFVSYNGDGFVALSYQSYSYTGGAHGLPANIYTCLDVRNKKVLQLSDILTIDTTFLEQQLETRFRKEFNLRPDDSLTQVLFDNKLLPNNNFTLYPSGLCFTYNPYEIAPYVVGIIDIFIPYKALKGLLKEGFKKRMHLSD